MAALVGHLDEQVAVRRVGDGHVGEVAQHDLHEHVLEPDAGAAERRGLVAAVRDLLGLGHRVPGGGAVEGQELGRQVERGVVDRHRPVDVLERVEGGALGGGDQLVGAGRRAGGRVWVVVVMPLPKHLQYPLSRYSYSYYCKHPVSCG